MAACRDPMYRIAVAVIVAAIASPFAVSSTGAAEAETSAQQVFERRIMPIFKSPNPSSCARCHPAGVDLKNYIRPSHEKTFVSLRDQGLIDLDWPEKSKILHLIKMGDKDNTEGAALIHERVRRAEYEAFAAWIKASRADPRLREAPKLRVSD